MSLDIWEQINSYSDSPSFINQLVYASISEKILLLKIRKFLFCCVSHVIMTKIESGLRIREKRAVSCTSKPTSPVTKGEGIAKNQEYFHKKT